MALASHAQVVPFNHARHGAAVDFRRAACGWIVMSRMRNAGLVLLVIAALANGCTNDESSGGSLPSGGVGGTGGSPSSGGTGAGDPSAGSAAIGASSGGVGGSGGAGGQAGGGGQAGTSVASGGSGGSMTGTGGGMAIDAGADTGMPDGGDEPDPLSFGAELHELFLHDACTGPYAPQPDTCLHEQEVEQTTTFGGEPGTTYDVTLRVRGVFEPTTINGGSSPLPAHPYFKVGGTVAAADYSRWHIEVGNPPQTYWLNHYPSTSHTIYSEDFEAVLAIQGGSEVVVRVIDGNDRQIDNAEMGPPDRRQLIEGVTDEVLDGQMLRLDVIAVEAR